ncbi:class I SAM-dependent methyltransferase [uncultured Enterovirga sp.]|uniref:class I SAM-dependent methyltransferase n=1 Tax=uncultured Enterovirga sp. TaxID=2026352 RepID=UPI0035C9CCDC
MNLIRFALAALLAAAPATLALAQAGNVPAVDAFPKPDRPVAEIISPQWATEAERDKVDEVGQVARLMGIGPGMEVADIGAGSGFYTVRLAKLVGPEGRVFAEDVTPAYLAGLERRLGKERVANVTVVRGEADDPKLPPASVDVAVLVHMYHEIAQPFGLLHKLAGAMKPGGRVGIVDLDDIPSRHGTPPKLLRCELAAVGYREVGFQTLKGDVGYLAIFAPPSAAQRPEPAAIKPCPDETTRTKPR